MSDQRVALVTGAASGIGLAITRRLVQSGVKVVLLDRSEAVHEVARALAESGAAVHSHVADLAITEQVLAAADRVKALGRCDILVNNAGIHPKKSGMWIPFGQIELPTWERVFRVNLTAPFLLCQQLLPLMQARRWGRIVNIASRAGRTFSDRAATDYSASKAALIAMTRKIAGEYAPHGITANSVAPGQIETPLARTSDPKVLEKAAASTPARRLGTADEVAAAVQFLASDEAAFVTGTVMDVNGGGFIG